MSDDGSTTGTTGTTTTATTDAAAAATTEAGKTFTQEQVNDLIAREKGNLQRKFEGFDDLKAKAARLDEIEAANQTDLERLTGQIDSLKGDVEPTKAENMRLRVALDKGVPADLIDRLRGGTKEELEADAEALMKRVGGPVGGHDGGPRGSAATAASSGDMNALIRQAAGR
jgi:hypothetical protein